MATRPQPDELHEHALREAEALRQMVEEISSELELRPLLTRIVTHACDLLEADDGSIGLFDPIRKVIRTEAVCRMPLREVGAEVGPGVGLAGAVLARGEAVVLSRYDELPTITLPELASNSVIGMPIVSHGKLVGFFGIGARPPRRLDERDLRTLELFGRHAAIAIDNAMRYQRERARNERMALIARVARLVSLQMEPRELVATAAQVIHEQLGYPNVVIPLLEKDELVYRSHSGAYRDVFKDEYRLNISKGIAGAAARTRLVQLSNDIKHDPRYAPPPHPIGDVCSELSVPIVLGHEVFGVINIEGSRAFEDEDVSSIQVIADHLAVAIKNAELFDESREAAVMRERARLARDLHDSVTQVLSSISMISQSLVSAWQRDAKEGERRAHRLEELAQMAFAEMRALLRELRPLSTTSGHAGTALGSREEVASYGLRRALQRLLAVLAPETPTVSLDFASYRYQALEHEEALYRICQEAIANALRHSGATNLSIRAEALDSGWVRVEVQDDGRGFDSTAAPIERLHGGLGSQTMSERATALGGRTTLSSVPGKGTRVIIELPRDDR
jgi:signal transduction histidine kinase